MESPIKRLTRAANRTVTVCDEPEFVERTDAAFALLGPDLAAQLRPGDTPALFVPGYFEANGGWQQAAAVLGESMVTIAWAVGLVKPATSMVRVEGSELATLRSGRRRVGRFTPQHVCVSVRGACHTWTLALPRVAQAEGLAALFVDVVQGVTRFDAAPVPVTD
jgi:hypothetical protein